MEIDIHACCYSEKADVAIGFGVTFESKSGDPSEAGCEWIFEGISASFWENHEEFENGIAQARAISAENCSMTYQQARLSVFGHFDLEFEVNGELTNLNSKPDVDDFMYSLLKDI